MKSRHISNIYTLIIFMVGQCLKNYQQTRFKWIDNNEINEDFIKNYNENNDKGYILEVDVK